jgi:outer membrane protein assembly factor BamB
MALRALTILITAALAQGAGADWPQNLGPSLNGSAAATGVFGPAPQLQKAWTTPLEMGNAGVVVADGRVFTLFRDGADDYVIALRADTGAEAWRAKLDVGVENAWLSGPPSTPAAHGGRVFTLSSACRLRAHDAATGKVAWDVDFKAKFGTQFQIGCAASPFVEGGRLYVQTGGREDHRVGAFDPATGQVLWTAKGAHRAANTMAVAADLGGVRQLLVHHNEGQGRLGITGVQMSDGAVLWSTPMAQGFSFDPPLAVPGDRVFLQVANEAHLVQVKREAGGWKATPAWRNPDLQAYVSTPVFHQGSLFGFGGDFLACVEADTGKTRWKEKIYPGSLILVDGHLVVLSTGAGLLRVVEASPAGYKEKARLEVFNKGAQALAPPAFAGRRIFVRNEEAVVAIDVR